MNAPIEIVRLGQGGDGIAADGTFVPFTVPGDVVRLGVGRDLATHEIITPGPSRIRPACGHFGICGGCSLQHVRPDIYLDWKRGLIVSALARQGFANVPIEGVRAVASGSRRRAAFKARRSAKGILVGFCQPQSRDLVDPRHCPVLTPSLADALPKFRSGLKNLLVGGDIAELHTTDTEAGLDVSLRWKRSSGPDIYAALAEFAQELNLARLSWNGEPIAVVREPYLRVGGHTVFLPVEPFLQPTRDGEAILQSFVRECVQGAGNVADLFAGCGTFALALAGAHKVAAVEGNAAMANALEDAARAKQSNVEVESRDLFRRPLLPQELSKFGAVILDPPRPGAKAQTEQLAKSIVPRVVYVSCNPSSFARDARILCDAGFKLQRVVPVDQFLWSVHVELVALLERDSRP